MNPTKYQKELLTYLGPAYKLQIIDFENCIYRKINDRYDIEISGTYTASHPIMICVWDISKGFNSSSRIIETIQDIRTKEDLKNTLDALIQKYQ